MRVRLPLSGALTAGLLAALSLPAHAAPAALADEMAGYNYLLGGPWNCTTTMSAAAGQPAQTEQVTLTFDVAPGNVLHDRILGAQYSDDDYFGYSPKMKMFWSVSADSLGNHGSAVSSDGKTYSGTTYMGHAAMSVATTYMKAGPGKSVMHETISEGGQQQTLDSTCTR